MTRTHRVSTTGALIACLIGTPLSSPLFASAEEPSSIAAPASPVTLSTPEPHFTYRDERFSPIPPVGAATLRISPDVLRISPVDSNSFAQRYQRYRGRGGRNQVQREAIVLGALASIAGGALLVYSNRPECSVTNHAASGCSYGTKVAGAAVLTGGMFGLLFGALTGR